MTYQGTPGSVAGGLKGTKQWIPASLFPLITDAIRNAMVGTPPLPTGGPWLLQIGTAVLTANAAGQATLSFPTAYSGGLLSFQVLNGDIGAWAGYVTIKGNTAAGVTLQTVQPQLANGNLFRVDWLAIGW